MDIAGHRLESLRGDPKLQESVEKKTLSADSTFTPTAPGLTSKPRNMGELERGNSRTGGHLNTCRNTLTTLTIRPLYYELIQSRSGDPLHPTWSFSCFISLLLLSSLLSSLPSPLLSTLALSWYLSLSSAGKADHAAPACFMSPKEQSIMQHYY